MQDGKKASLLDRREFMKLSVMAALGANAPIAHAGPPQGEGSADTPVHLNQRPSMTYHKLGRTNLMSSRLVFGGGAALSGGKAVRVLDRAFEAGINHYDLGSNNYYKGAERHFAPFMKAHRKDIWVVSKGVAPVRADPKENITSGQAKQAAELWSKLLDGSLKDLNTDYVDAYYLMAVNNPSLVRSEEIYGAFLRAKKAGKVGFFGISTHENAESVLEAMIDTQWYDIAMIGITPAGWYDWNAKNIAKGTPTMASLGPLWRRAENAGIGLVGMKATRHLSIMEMYHKTKPNHFDHLYDEKLMSAPLNAYQRAYAYVLENGMHVVNSDMQNFKHLEENIVAASASRQYFSGA